MFTARFKPVSNQGDWATWIRLNNRADGTPIDLSAVSATLAAQLLSGARCANFLTGSTASGELTNPSLGILQVFFPVATMQALSPGSYRVGLTITNGIFTKQLILGLLPIVAGVVNFSSVQGDYS
jgi:hypothetical protein